MSGLEKGRTRIRKWILELKMRVAGLEIFALAMLVGLLFTFVYMALENAPTEDFAVVSIAIGGFTLLMFLDRIVSARCPSRSITEGGRISILGILCYLFGLTILSVVFTYRPINNAEAIMTDAMHLYGGIAGAVLLLCGVCSVLYMWQMPPRSGAKTFPGMITLGGGTFTHMQITDLRNGICPRCGRRMEPSRMDFDNTERWFCRDCYEFFVVRT